MYVGTFGHEVWKVPVNFAQKRSGAAENLIYGHYAPLFKDNNEAWGLSIVPKKDQVVTVSDDSTLRVWDLTSHKMVRCVSLLEDAKGNPIAKDTATKENSKGTMGRSVDVSPSGAHCAVGLRDGSLRVYNTSNWKMIYLKKISKEWIEDLKFSPDGQYLAVGSHDNKIYLYQVQNFKFVKKFGVSSSFITHIDWSQDSQAIRTNDGSYEILYYSIPDGTQVKSGASNYRNEIWATQSCVLAWPMQGVWQPGQDGSDINHADRSCGPLPNGQEIVATANDDGQIKLYRYPSVQEGSAFTPLIGHSSHVTKVRFNSRNTYLLSLGGNDTSVMQWKISQ